MKWYLEEQDALAEKENDEFQTESVINLRQSIQLFNEYLLSTYHVPSIVPGWVFSGDYYGQVLNTHVFFHIIVVEIDFKQVNINV